MVWAPTTAGRRLDGAWCPRGRDAAAELVALVPLVSEHLVGPVRRASLNIDAWDSDRPDVYGSATAWCGSGARDGP